MTTDRNLGDAIQTMGKQLAGRFAESERRAKAAETRIEELRQREDLWREQVRRLSDDHHASTDLFEHAHRELQKRGRAYRDLREETRAATDALRRTVADQRAALDAQRAELGRLGDQLDALQKELADARAEAAALRRQESRMARLLDEALSAARTERSRAEALGSACATRDEKIRSLEQVLAAETQALRESLQEKAEPAGTDDDDAAAKGWYVRDGDGAEYGPATLADLQAWAAECRVAAHHEVSRDRARWQRAGDLDALGLVWTVPLLSGAAFGPVSAGAVAYLVRNGLADADAVAENRRTRERLPAASVSFTNPGAPPSPAAGGR